MLFEVNKASISGSEGWEDWELQFKTQAIDLQLWDYITDDEPLLGKPKKLQMSSYQRQAQARGGVEEVKQLKLKKNPYQASL